MKTCTKCKQEKSKDDFSKKSSKLDGYSDWCRVCMKKQTLIRTKRMKEGTIQAF